VKIKRRGTPDLLANRLTDGDPLLVVNHTSHERRIREEREINICAVFVHKPTYK
jgi:hypothetical protein